MEERTERRKPNRLTGNITRFRQDKRLAVTGVLHSLALLGMLACVVLGIFRYHESLRPENLSRLTAYLKAAGSVTDPFTRYEFEAGLDTVFEPFGSGLAVASGDTYSFVSGLGSSRYSIQLRYGDPAIRTGDSYVLLYDRGGTGFCVANHYAEYLNGNTDSPILTADMNAEGDFALVTDQAGCRSAVTVYDSRQRLLCQWLTTQYYVMMASVSPDGDCFAALCLGQEGLTSVTRVLYFEIGQETPVWSLSLEERQVLALAHDKSGGLVILCADGILRCDGEDGSVTASRDFSRELRMFSLREEGEVLLAFDTGEQGSRGAEILLLGDGLERLWSGSCQGTLRAVSCRGGTACLLTYDRLTTVRLSDDGTAQTETTAVSGPRSVTVSPRGEPILIYSDRAEKVADGKEDA